ncbi:O-antigen polymerase [Truepera radiovictrix DSM 17093]|uniref:O-antigen polymerase n=2 Tax=Truepera TaxID=332248 RepID=D7CUW7_TRURR|nr:O-antigen ligase family protein [Truepera radiovictrix]ADI14108.1 O-antigen polymerase [Truepera radiovictrix DSM 17093]WMT57330.1 O-antigen ligase family protein [Truepera radiovictrix]
MRREPKRGAYLAFWVLLFVLFPLVTMPKALLEAVPPTLITFPENGFAEVLLPKLAVFVVLWGLGAWLCLKRWRSGQFRPLRSGSPLRAPYLWLALFLFGSTVVSFLNPSSLGLSLPLVSSRYESILFGLLESAWYALAVLAAGVFSSRALKPALPLHLLAAGALAAGLWALAEAYGVHPMRLFDDTARVGINVQATLGHQGYVAAFLAVVLVFWVTWRLLQNRLRPFDVLLVALLTAALVATGGRAGVLAAVLTLSALGVYWVRARGRSRYLLLLGAVMLIAGALPLLTSSHAQARLDRLGSAVQGRDPATSHRLIFWQVGLRGIAQRPLSGYGIDSFGNAAWFFASPEEAREMVTEFLPRETAETSLRIGRLVLYRGEDAGLVLQSLDPYRVHNYLLDIAFASGVPVALLFLGFVAASLRALWRERTPLALATALALLTYLLYGMAWFATPNVDPLVWGLLGLGLGSLEPRPAAPEHTGGS